MSNQCIVVCGEKFNIGTRVVLWDEPNGLNGYDTSKYTYKQNNRKTGKSKTVVVKGVRYSKRTWRKNPTLKQLQTIVTQFFLHHSGLYRSKSTFHVLHKERRLSCHFILDDDGTIYQTLDLKEKAWHGGKCNPMSIGIEIDSRAHVRRFPTAYDKYHQRRHNVGPRKKRKDNVQGMEIEGYEYSPAQYKALINLGIKLCEIFPIIGTNANFPVDKNNNIVKKKIANPKKHLGFICHYNSSSSKNDPIAFDHNRFLSGIKNKDPHQKSSFTEVYSDLPPERLTGQDLINYPVTPSAWKAIQLALNTLEYNCGTADGIPGKKTRRAIRKFQEANDLYADSIWGPKTRAKVIELLNE